MPGAALSNNASANAAKIFMSFDISGTPTSPRDERLQIEPSRCASIPTSSACAGQSLFRSHGIRSPATSGIAGWHWEEDSLADKP